MKTIKKEVVLCTMIPTPPPPLKLIWNSYHRCEQEAMWVPTIRIYNQETIEELKWQWNITLQHFVRSKKREAVVEKRSEAAKVNGFDPEVFS